MSFRFALKLALASCASTAALSLGAPAFAQAPAEKTYQLNIPAGPLDQALVALADQTGVSVFAPADLVRGHRAAAVRGSLTPKQGVDRLLAGSGLTATRSVTGGFTIVRAQARAVRRPETSNGAEAPSKKDDGGQARGVGLDEVVVTAQKRGEERLKEVPIPISVINTDKIASDNQVTIREYYNTVPGFAMVANFGYRQNLAIRGITTGGFSNPTVGITVDDAPFGASTSNAGSNDVPDIDPGDLARIEVLRGPQGTLYGASSMGGLVRYVTKDPSLGGFNGRVEVGSSKVRNGGDFGHTARGSLNIPVNADLALRVTAFDRKEPGYIDNPVLGLDGVNSMKSSGARISALWEPIDAVTMRLSALYQHNRIGGVADAFIPTAGAPETLGLGDLEQNYMPGTGASDRKVQAYSANLVADLGWSSLTSFTSYNINKYRNYYDRTVSQTASLGPTVLNNFKVTGIIGQDSNNVKKFSQELRLASPNGQRLEWLVGAFYTRERTHGRNDFYAANRTTGAVAGEVWVRHTPYLLQQLSAFGTVTYHFTDQFDLQVGGRYSQDKEHDYPYVQSGIFIGPSPLIAPVVDSRTNSFTHLLAARYKLSPDVMAYARWSSGYRPGGPNFPTPGAPERYAPDKTQNYEVGIKGDFFDDLISIDASIYYIDWKDIQISLRPQTATYLTNGSRAKSEGVEFSGTVRPTDGLTITGWVAYNNAVLTESFPAGSPVYGMPGNRLPNSARYSGYLSVTQEFEIQEGLTGYVGASLTYTGDRVSQFTGSPLRQVYPSYTKVDLRAGLEYGTWAANIYVNNVGDERGVVAGGVSYQPVYAFSYIQPRTIGVAIAKSF